MWKGGARKRSVRSGRILPDCGENAGMNSSTSWRDQLLGSLQGQLQLATYLAVFIGFTGASSVGLWTGQRNLTRTTPANCGAVPNRSRPACARGGPIVNSQQELLLHSSMRTSLWVENADGSLVLPQSDHLETWIRPSRPPWPRIRIAPSVVRS